MNNLLPILLSLFQNYGYLALWITVFVAAIGLPIPITLVLLAGGAFAALGDFNVVLLFIVSFSALICGDNIGYLIGRIWGSKALNWMEHSKRWNRLIPPRTIGRSRYYFRHRGGWAIFLSRFLFSALGGVINLFSGSELYPYRYFLICDISGEALGAIIPLLLGYSFGASWEAVGDVIGYTSFLILCLLVVILLATRLLRNARSLKRLHAASMSQTVEVQSNPAGASAAAESSGGTTGKLPLL